MKSLLLLLSAAITFLAPVAASAHEVYVLSPQETTQAISAASPNPFSVIPEQEFRFIQWGVVVAGLILVVLAVAISPLFERVFDPFLWRLKKYAPFIGRITFGVALIASGWFGAFFGPELPVAASLGAGAAHVFAIILMIAGVMVCLGFLTRIVSLFMLCVFVFTIFKYHGYMLTYVNYLGETLLFLILGGGAWSLDRAIPFLARIEKATHGLHAVLERYSFLILRVLFGFSLFYASFYAKFLHSNLALATVIDYHLTNYFPFTPLFLVLGAFLVEAIFGFCFFAGFEIRFAALAFTFFLTLSILFFGEAVWPHIILFGVNIALFFHGYDKYTIERALFQRARKGEPVL
jgi:uncharacterized membrane protein YphA (DoxX/SURF4 family)